VWKCWNGEVLSLPVTRHGTEKKETHRRTSKHILRKHSHKEKVEREGGEKQEFVC